MGLIIALLVIWLVLSVVGFAVKGLLWLAIIGLVLFVATGVWGWVKRKARA
jgi:putative Ca2+/H+ antiporter (TMEM165/GDT1 family)